MHTFFTRLAARWQRFVHGIQEARRRRRDMTELAHMSAHELRDIGFPHRNMARAAAGTASACC